MFHQSNVDPQASPQGSVASHPPASLSLRFDHYPSTSSADESIGELPAPRETGYLSRNFSSEPTSPLSTGRSQVLAQSATYSV
jgi:hypothetical protein